MQVCSFLRQHGQTKRLKHLHHRVDLGGSDGLRRTIGCNFEIVWHWQSHYGGNVVLLLGELDEVEVFAFLDVVVVYDDDWGAFAHLSTELLVVFAMNLEERVCLVGPLAVSITL